MATTPTILETLSNQVQDELPQVVHESLPGMDPVYKYIDQSYIGVESHETANMGYRWRVNHLYSGGMAGLIQPANPEGPDLEDTDQTQDVKFLDADHSNLTPFPNALESPHSSVIKRTLTLHRQTGNHAIPVEWMQMDKLSAAHVKQVAMDIRKLGRNRAYMEAMSFYQNWSNNYPVMGQVDGSWTADSNYQYTATIENGRIAFFRPGMMVDVYSDSSGVNSKTNGSNNLVVVKVDYVNKQITLADHASAAINGIGLTDDDWIMWKGAGTQYRPQCTWGLENWIKSSGYLFQSGSAAGGISLSSHPHFASQVVAVNAALTDTVLNGYVGGFIDAYMSDVVPDTIITTWGATLKYIQQPNGSGLDRMMFERTGKAMSVHGGFSEVDFSFNGRNMKWMISSMCLPGYLYALKLGGGNLKRYVPPMIGGKGDSRIGNEIQFLAPVAGHSGIFMGIVNSNGSPMSAVQLPFWQYRLIAPIEVRGIKLTGLTEATMS